MIKLSIFVVGSLFVTAISWRSLGDTRSHGFYRFFAFEALLLLFLRNVDWWFVEAFSPAQIASWLLLFSAAAFAIDGFYLLRRGGKPRPGGADSPLLGFEQTTILVTAGVFKLVRHPLYSSLLLLGWGIFLKRPSLQPLAITVVASCSLFLTARIEERENLAKFGDAYLNYRNSTKMFIPYLF